MHDPDLDAPASSQPTDPHQPGYCDLSLLHEFIEQYAPGTYQNCDTIFTEPMLRDIFNAHRDQDMTFTDPWLQYKTALIDRGYRFHPNAELHTSVMYVKELQPEILEEI